MTQMSVPLSKDELEALIRRVVREEPLHLVPASGNPLLDDNYHEGLDNPAEDVRLLALPAKKQEERQQLRAAAEALLSDYGEGSELTAFTALDSEDYRGYSKGLTVVFSIG